MACNNNQTELCGGKDQFRAHVPRLIFPQVQVVSTCTFTATVLSLHRHLQLGQEEAIIPPNQQVLLFRQPSAISAMCPAIPRQLLAERLAASLWLTTASLFKPVQATVPSIDILGSSMAANATVETPSRQAVHQPLMVAAIWAVKATRVFCVVDPAV